MLGGMKVLKEVLAEAEERMEKTLDHFRRELAGIRAGRANPALLDKIRVEYYGEATPLNQLASIGVPEPRLLVIQPWDKTSIPAIEKALLKSDLGITPASDGNVVRLAIPQLTEERRQELVKLIRKKTEEQRVAIRNVRRDANDMIKSFQKDGEVTEDEARRGTDEVQKLTDKYIGLVDEVLGAKEKEVMEV